ncbi:DUF1273 domain-containing protein [Jeotgalibacillus sp. R-1-5s-1]|uniref:DUF1273 domain-containing protein n=1 Tax=Jeotgalibacillus sp. R-1-5s-1 TaxID=2555897 RepID=UPI00106A79EE|nr:DUF1273 domain-containing protein [Jeotgalibacillus sp. R-1-5s-1]TFE03248.1 DUF1273 domain-containing protein [Jeotgalibacillus sp. R-1-5s-1]
MKILTVTGYRAQELGIFTQKDPAVQIIKKAISQSILQKLDEGLEWVLISGQLGVELWAGEVVIELQKDYPDLKLAVITAFQEMESKWNEANQELFHTIISHADFYDSVSRKPYENPSQFRNRDLFLLQKSDGLLLVYDPENEGSPKYIKEMAESAAANGQLELIQITFQDLQWIAEEAALDQNIHDAD